MNSCNADKKQTNRANFLTINHNLKRIILEFLPIGESLNSMFSCDKSFIKIFKRTKIFNLINKGAIRRLLNSDDSRNQFFFEKILANWQTFFETFEETQFFISRILNKINSNSESFFYKEDSNILKFAPSVKIFLIKNISIKEINIKINSNNNNEEK